MTDHHPITPPPELVEQWRDEAFNLIPDGDYPCPFDIDDTRDQHIATQAARWGSDQELEACCEWLEDWVGNDSYAVPMRVARRPEPPSLKELALEALDQADKGLNKSEWQQCSDTIRRALEQLDDH